MKVRSNRTVTVIGVGNEFRRDDGAGVIAAQRIEKERLPGVNVIRQSGEGTALIEAWRKAELVFIIDAGRSEAGPGEIFRFDARKQKLPLSVFNNSTHAFSVAEAIELARILDCLPPGLIVYAIEGKNFETGTGLSPEVGRAIEKVCQSITAEILELS